MIAFFFSIEREKFFKKILRIFHVILTYKDTKIWRKQSKKKDKFL